MVSAETKRVIEKTKAIYESELRENLEAEHRDRFVSIEPKSGKYFLGDTFDEAVKAAKTKHPTRLSHTIHIGHPAAFTIGLMEQ